MLTDLIPGTFLTAPLPHSALADLITRTVVAVGGAPITVGGTGLVLACGGLYLVTRASEFLTMTAIAGLYAAVAVMPAVHC